MQWSLRFAFFLVLISNHTVLGQTVPQQEKLKNDVTMIALFNPAYPPLARSANVVGDVKLQVGIRKDGSVASVTMLSGAPMLKDAAINSAKQSRFLCRGCEADITPYILIYSFDITNPDSIPGWPCPAENAPENKTHISQLQNHITITASPIHVIADFSNVSARSIKCLYLSRCGSRWGGYDYFYYRVRSMKCLDLWNCGYQLKEPFATCERLHHKLAY